MHLPTVDIIIAAKNEARLIGSCLEALERQDYPHELLQIYVVDNGSTDETARVADRHTGVNVSRAEKPGAASARNAGLRQSSGELVAFLDAHCVVDRNWVGVMADNFKTAVLGGCQGYIENRSINERVQKYLDESGSLSNERIIEDTVSGKRNIYPWILSGSCMYRREALDVAGFFNEELRACEDVDLAWRVVLSGYQLGYVPHARLIHYNCDPWLRFLTKAFDYGSGAAAIASIYKPHGAREKFLPSAILSKSPERFVSGIFYWAGFRQKEWRLRLKLEKPPIAEMPTISRRFRQPFRWSPTISLGISRDAVFWFRDDEPASVIVHIPTNLRVVLDNVGNFIWRRVAQGVGRETLIGQLSAHYGVASATAGSDLDDLVEELIETGILARL